MEQKILEKLKEKKKLIFSKKDDSSFVFEKNNKELTIQGFLLALFLLFITPFLGIPDQNDFYLYLFSFFILILSIIKIGIEFYQEIEEYKIKES